MDEAINKDQVCRLGRQLKLKINISCKFSCVLMPQGFFHLDLFISNIFNGTELCIAYLNHKKIRKVFPYPYQCNVNAKQIC